MYSQWLFAVWIALVVFAHVFSIFFLLRSSQTLRHSRAAQYVAALWAHIRHRHADTGKPARALPTPKVVRKITRSELKLFLPRRALLAWRGVGCSYPASGGGRKVVLRDALGVVCEGQLAALLGPSGGGKSTLLETLAGRKALGDLVGDVGLMRKHELHAVPVQTMLIPDAGQKGAPLPTKANSAGPVAYGHGDGPQVSHKESEWCRQESAIDASALRWRGVKKHALAVKHISAFVAQDESFPVSLTAGEVMWLRASLLGVDLSGSHPPTATQPANGIAASANAANGSLKEYVMGFLSDVGLELQANTVVGGPLPGGLTLRGLSGGERKRLAVAAGLLGRPRLLLLDEPTTGLDAHAAASLMDHLVTLCWKQGLSVMCTIHQPRASIWEFLDVVVLLSQGYPIYSGPREGLIPHIEHLGYPYVAVKHGAPANWALDLVNISFDKPEEFFGHTMTSVADLSRAAEEAVAQWTASHPQLTRGMDADPSAAASAKLVSSRTGTTAVDDKQDGVTPANAVSASDAQGGVAGGFQVAEHDTVECGVTPNSSVAVNADMPTCGAAVAKEHTALPAIGVAFTGEGMAGEVVTGLEPMGMPEGAVDQGKGTRGEGNQMGSGGMRSREEMTVRQQGGSGASWFRQVSVLAWRDGVLAVRNPLDLVGRMLVFCWAGLVVGAVFFNLPMDVQGLISRTIVSYVQAILLFLLPFVYMSMYISDRHIITGELVSGLYHPSAYYAAKAILLSAFSSLNVIVFAGIVYGMAGLQSNGGLFVYHLILSCLGYLTAQQFLYCASLFAPSQDAAFSLGIVFTAINIILSNYPIRLSEYTMSWVTPLKYVSAMYYTFSGMLAVQFRHVPPASCAGGIAVDVVNRLPAFLPNTPAAGFPFVQYTLTHPGDDCYMDLMNVVRYFGVQVGVGKTVNDEGKGRVMCRNTPGIKVVIPVGTAGVITLG